MDTKLTLIQNSDYEKIINQEQILGTSLLNLLEKVAFLMNMTGLEYKVLEPTQ
jgi:hypothetical protein